MCLSAEQSYLVCLPIFDIHASWTSGRVYIAVIVVLAFEAIEECTNYFCAMATTSLFALQNVIIDRH